MVRTRFKCFSVLFEIPKNVVVIRVVLRFARTFVLFFRPRETHLSKVNGFQLKVRNDNWVTNVWQWLRGRKVTDFPDE